MKRAKIMLSAIAVLAVVGGALAFKAKDKANIYCKIALANPICQKVAYTTNFVPGALTTTDPCPEETLYYTDNTCSTPIEETTTRTVTVTDL